MGGVFYVNATRTRSFRALQKADTPSVGSATAVSYLTEQCGAGRVRLLDAV